MEALSCEVWPNARPRKKTRTKGRQVRCSARQGSEACVLEMVRVQVLVQVLAQEQIQASAVSLAG